ncbi:MAG: cobalamin-binding protein, partial [Firmicutes bacterium]|nr:cobalamin-binding protein [Bacillota bacterium]
MLDYEALTKAVGDLEEETVLNMLKEFVAQNPSQEEGQKAVAACQSGMAIVGDLFEQGEYFVGDLIFAGELLTNAIEILKPVIGQESSEKIGKIVLGTVHG